MQYLWYLVVGGVQHVDCVTFSTLIAFIQSVVRERQRKREREREKEKEREREGRGRGRGRRRGRGTGTGTESDREEEEEEEENKEKKHVKGVSFFTLGFRISSEKNAALVNPGNKPSKVNWALSWSSALEMCGKTVLY